MGDLFYGINLLQLRDTVTTVLGLTYFMEKTSEIRNFLVPMVVEKTQQGERAFHIFSRLL